MLKRVVNISAPEPAASTEPLLVSAGGFHSGWKMKTPTRLTTDVDRGRLVQLYAKPLAEARAFLSRIDLEPSAFLRKVLTGSMHRIFLETVRRRTQARANVTGRR